MHARTRWVLSAALSSASVISAAAAHAELLNHWSLDQTAGFTAPDSKGGLAGSVGGTSAWAGGKIANGFKTTGNALGYINNGNVNFTGSFALSFWVNPENVALDWRNMLSKHDGADGQKAFWIGQKDTDGAMRFGMYFDGAAETTLDTSSALIGSGQWSFITAGWNEKTKTQSLFVNGNLAASAVRTGKSFLNPRSSNFLFSTNNTSSSNVVGVGSWARFPGTLDDVAVWDSLPDAGRLKAIYNAPTVAGLPAYNAADFEQLHFAADTNFSVEVGDKRWKRATGLALGEGNIAQQPNGHAMQFNAAGVGVTSLSTVSLTADPINANLATANQINIATGLPLTISEIDGLTSNESIGSANFRPYQIDQGDIYVMLWLTDTTGTDDRATLRAELDAVSGAGYDLLNMADAQWSELSTNHAGFDTLIRFNQIEIGGAFNWDFAAHTDVRLDQVAVVTTGAPVPEPATAGLLAIGAAMLRRRKAGRHAR